MRNWLIIPALLIASITVAQNIAADLKKMLPEGKMLVDVMDSIAVPEEMIPLGEKFKKGIADNYDWYMDQVKKVQDGKKMEYSYKFGLTEQEFKRYYELIDEMRSVVTSTDTVTIYYTSTSIRFKARGRLDILNYYEIKTDSNICKVDMYKLDSTGPVDVLSDKNVLQSAYKGYGWEYHFPENLDLDAMKNLSNVTFKRYKITLAVMKKTGKTLLHISGNEVINGARYVGFDTPMFFYKPK